MRSEKVFGVYITSRLNKNAKEIRINEEILK